MEKNEKFKSELENQYTILIQAQERSEKRRFIALFVVICITLISVIVSMVFAFIAYRRSSSIRGDIDQVENIYYQTLSTVYNNSAKLEINDIVTGYRLETPKTIQITNDGDVDVTYNIKLSSIKSSLISTNNLFYTLSSDGETGTLKQLPLTDKVILDNVKIGPNETKTYTLDVLFQGTMSVEDASNYYQAYVVVEQIDNKSNLLE